MVFIDMGILRGGREGGQASLVAMQHHIDSATFPQAPEDFIETAELSPLSSEKSRESAVQIYLVFIVFLL